MRSLASVILASALGAIAPVAAAQEAAPPASATGTKMSEIDAAGATATVMVPPGWAVTTQGAATVLTAPEGDLKIALIPITAPVTGDAAVAQAWKAFMPAFARPVRLAQDTPGRDGWDASRVVDYDIAPAEKHVSQGIALKKGDGFTVVLVDGALATTAKRGGQLGQAFGSLRPKGFAKESFAGKAALHLDPARIEALKAFVLKAMADLQVPGVGFSLIDDGKIVWEGGLGVKDTATKAPVDEDTLFMIASNTKGMATLLLATLVDEGKLDWNKPVTDYMPEFRLGSAETTKKVLVKHLVCACTGLPRKDMQWLFNTADDTPASSTFTQLAATEPTSGFGEVFQYNNLMAAAAGYLGAHIIYPDMELGAAFDRAMQERIFDALGMTKTTLSNEAAMSGDWAKPYATDLHNEVAAVDPAINGTIDPFRPAGGAWSSAHDMALYVRNELLEGALPGGKRIVSKENLLARRVHNVPTGDNEWYGMGLEDDAAYGVSVIQHGGSLFGYKSNWFAVPSAGVGAVVLTNSDEGYALANAVKRRLLEVLYDGKTEAAENVTTAARQSDEYLAKLRGEITYPVPNSFDAQVVGHYSNADLGPLVIAREDGRLMWHATSLSVELATKKNADGTTSVITNSPGFIGADALLTTREGKPAIVLNDNQHEYVWLRD